MHIEPFVCYYPLCVVQLEIKSWLVTGESLSMELLKTEKGNTTVALTRLRELQNTSASNHKTVRLPLCLSQLLLVKILTSITGIYKMSHEPLFSIISIVLRGFTESIPKEF